jgi:hypothetical protein
MILTMRCRSDADSASDLHCCVFPDSRARHAVGLAHMPDQRGSVMERTFEFTAGIFVRRQVRDELNRIKFYGVSIDWLETKKALESDFVVKAPQWVIDNIKRSIVAWNAK